VEDIIILIN